MTFVGYHSTRAYKLYNPIKKKMTISRDVVFLEDECWNWEIDQTSMKTSKFVMQLPLQVEEDSRETETRINEDQNRTSSTEISTRPRRQTMLPSRYTDFEMFSDAGVDEEGDIVHLALLAGSEPVDVNEALAQPHWKGAMEEELRSIEKNKTWKMVDLPPNKQCIDVKWVFKTKLNPDGTISKHKARLVAKGFLQREGIDFKEVYAPVATLDIIRAVISIACAYKWRVFALDIKSPFLHGHLEEEVYVRQPPGFRREEDKHKVYRLYKALYGLRQAPRAWNKRINVFLESQGFERCKVEQSLYVKKDNKGNMLILCL